MAGGMWQGGYGWGDVAGGYGWGDEANDRQ